MSSSTQASTPIDLPLERSFYIGNEFAAIMYGIQLCITFHSVYLLVKSPVGQRAQKAFYIAYGIVMLLCMSLSMIDNALMGQEMWIEHRNYPGGPLAFFGDNGSIWYNILGSAADMFGNFLGDALLVYRCYVIWGGRWYVVLLPTLIFLASTAFAIISVVESAAPGSTFFQTSVINFAVPWIALTCTLNAVVTVMISARLFSAHKQLAKTMPHEMVTVYTGVIAILVESALPFTILGIAFAIVLSKQVPEQLVMAGIWGAMVGIAPQLIILRVSMGVAWSKHTINSTGVDVEFHHHGARTYTSGTETQLGTAPYSRSNQSIGKSSFGKAEV